MQDSRSITYINSSVYSDVEDKIKTLRDILDDKMNTQLCARKLRYADVHIEEERAAGRIMPDELYIPQHIIDTNIRREQSAYVQYITQSPRAVITADVSDKTVDMSLLDEDLTGRIRFEGWQSSMFQNIDGFQSFGYSVMEVVQDMSNPGEVGYESFPFGDFAHCSDTKDIQAVEFVARQYYFTKTRLLALCGDSKNPNPQSDWSREQVDKIIAQEPTSLTVDNTEAKDKSLYRVLKVMYRISGTVNVAWAYPNTCDNWIRVPRPLYLGLRKQKDMSKIPQQEQQMLAVQAQQSGIIPSDEQYETEYPYIVFPYLISENDIISELKGRVFLDQDLQEAVTSLLSSTCTQARRAAGLYGSRDTADPNDDFLMQKNIYLKSGCVVNSKISFTQLAAPDPGMYSAINALISSNQNETSQVNFAALNRKDSRKTAKEITVSEKQEQILSTVQVVLFSIALTQLYRKMVTIIKSRVLFGLIKDVLPPIKALYQRNFIVKPSGDSDVIEKQQLINNMQQALPFMQQSAAGPLFICDLLELMFPDRAAKYIQAIQQQIQQQQSAQAQQQQQMMQFAMGMAKGIVMLSKHSDYFSEIGKIHALPMIEQVATQIEQMQEQMQQGQKQQQKMQQQHQPKQLR